MAKHWRTEIAKITDPAKRRVTFSKRRAGLFKKTKALCELTAARAAVIVFSQTGKVYSFGKPSVEPVISDYLRSESELMPPKGPREWVSWVEKELDSWATKEDLDFLEAKCETFLDCVRKQLEEVGAGGYSPVGVCCDSEDLNDDEIDSLIENFKASRPSLFALFKDYVRHGDRESHITSPVNLAAGGGSSGAESASMHSLIEGCTYNAASSGSSCLVSTLTCFDVEVRGFNPDDFLNLSEDCISAGDRDGLLTLPENLAVGGGSSSGKHLQTPPPMAKRRRTEIVLIKKLPERRVTFCKRRDGLFSKTKALCNFTAARAAVIVFSQTGKVYSFGKPSVEEVISEYLRCQSELMQPKGLREWVDWVEKELDSCATEEDLDFLEAKCETVIDCVRKKLEEVGVGGHSPVGVCCDSEDLNDDEIDSLIENFKASRPSLFALFKDYVRHGDRESHITSPVNLAAGGGSSGAESAPVHSLIEGCTYNVASGGSSVFSPDNFVNLPKDCTGAGDRDGLMAVGGGSSREQPGHSDLEGYGYNPDDFAGLEDLVSIVI